MAAIYLYATATSIFLVSPPDMAFFPFEINEARNALSVPLVYVSLAGPIVALTMFLCILLMKRTPRGHCRRCGYDLAGNVSGICPECGTALRKRDMGQQQRTLAPVRPWQTVLKILILNFILPMILCASLTLFWIMKKAERLGPEFNAQCWRQGDRLIRRKMAGSLEHSRELWGTGFDNVVSLLGSPDKIRLLYFMEKDSYSNVLEVSLVNDAVAKISILGKAKQVTPVPFDQAKWQSKEISIRSAMAYFLASNNRLFSGKSRLDMIERLGAPDIVEELIYSLGSGDSDLTIELKNGSVASKRLFTEN